MASIMLKNNRNILYLAAGMFLGLTNLMGCWSEFDYSVLDLNPNDAVDYINLAQENKLSPGTREYALLSSNPGSREIRRQLQIKLENIASELSALEELGANLAGADANNHKQYIKEFRQTIEIPVTAKAATAHESYTKVVALAQELQQDIRKSGAILRHFNRWQQWFGSVAPGLLSNFNAHQDKIINIYKKLYQQSVILAQALPQEELLNDISIIEKNLDGVLIGYLAAKHRPQAQASLEAALKALMLVRGRVAKLTQAPKIQPALKTSLSHFEIALDKLEKDYLGKIPKGDNRSDALNKFQKIRASVYRLAVIANNIAANESVKNPSDAELKKILEETFTGNLALSTPVALDLELSKNDLVKIIDKLKTHKTLGLKRAEDSGELIKALGLAVGVGLAEERGLPITKVIGLNDDSLNKIKQDFGLANHEFGLYATTRAQKVYERFSSAKQHPNIYVIFADELSSGADLAKIIEIFTQDNNKIIIIADRPEEYSPHSTYVAAGLNGVTGYYVARAVAEAMYPNDINLDQKVEPLVKLFYVQGRAGQMNLVSLPLAVKDTMLRLQQGTKELKAVEETLESLKKEPLELKKLNIPRVLGDSFRKIEVNKADKNYYFMRTF